MLRISKTIDALNAAIGRASSWLLLVIVIVSVANAIVRKTMGISSNAWLELQWYLFGAVFLLAASYTLQKNDHVRIDIVSAMLSNRTRHWIDILGHSLMLLPFSALIVYEAVPVVISSIRQQETSANAGGLLVWPAKAVILLGFALLFLQGVSELIKRIAILRGQLPDPLDKPSEQTVAEAMILKDQKS